VLEEARAQEIAKNLSDAIRGEAELLLGARRRGGAGLGC
jgi:hypothetical protein